MRKAVRYILSSLYILLAIFMTIFLLSKNKYNLAEIGNNTLVIIDQNNELYRSGDLLLIKKQNNIFTISLLIIIFCSSIYYLYIGLNNPFLYFSF